MASRLFYIFLIFLLIPTVLHAKVFHPEATDDLEVTKFWTNIYFKPDTETAVMSFRVWFEAPPNQVWQVLTDTAAFETKMNTYQKARTLSRKLFNDIMAVDPASFEQVELVIGTNKLTSDHNRSPGNNWTDYIYFRFAFPWPLTDRWAVQRMKCDETNATQGEYKLDYKMEVGNFKLLQGKWTLAPVANHPGWTEFYGEYESDAGIPVPHFITKKAMNDGLYKDVEAYRKILKGK